MRPEEQDRESEHEAEPVDVRFAPSTRFPSLVRTYWEVHGNFPHVHERVLPTADVFVLVNLGAPHLLIAGHRRTIYSDAWVSGIQQEALVTGALGATDVWGAKLAPRAAGLAFGSAAAVAGTVVEFGDLLGAAGKALAGRLRDAGSFEERCAIFDAHIAAAINANGSRWRQEIEWALTRIIAGEARIGDLAGEIGWSRKHLHHHMVNHLGLPPKTLARIARFERALRIMEGDRPLADVALAAGYYDQAQFTREFRSLGGITPAAYLRSRVAGAEYGFVDADG